MGLPLNGILLLGVIFLLNGQIITAWMGHFNRDSRDIFPPIAYPNHAEAHVNDIGYRPDPQNGVYGIVESVVENEPCFARKCSPDHICCPGSICVYTERENGNCVFFYGRKIGDFCHQTSDCETGLTCDKGPDGITMVCLPPMIAMPKQFGEDCNTSNDCDITRGLCCQLHRRHHRRVAKKICNYIKDPLTCIDAIPIDEEIVVDKGISVPYLNGFN